MLFHKYNNRFTNLNHVGGGTIRTTGVIWVQCPNHIKNFFLRNFDGREAESDHQTQGGYFIVVIKWCALQRKIAIEKSQLCSCNQRQYHHCQTKVVSKQFVQFHAIEPKPQQRTIYNSIFNYGLISICETSLNDSIELPEIILNDYRFVSVNNPTNTRHDGWNLSIKILFQL